jgi:hypothetical protein
MVLHHLNLSLTLTSPLGFTFTRSRTAPGGVGKTWFIRVMYCWSQTFGQVFPSKKNG